MPRVREPVKGRSEAGRRREERARATRQRIVAAATDLFLEHGYAATTVEAIAKAAGVGVATVYQAFGTKAAVLARALEERIAGDADPVPVLQRDWVEAARREPDARRRLELIVSGGSRIAARTAPLKEVMRDAAATEPEIRAVLHHDDAQRLETQRGFVEVVLGRPADDATVAGFYALANSASFQLLVTQLGWDEETWRDWMVEVLTRQLGLDAG